MNSKSDKGCHILYERQERISKEKGQRIYIKNTQTEVRELFRRTADKNNTASKKARDQIQQKACKLNQQIKQEIEQLKLLSHNILQNPVESKASESDMEMHDNKAEARQSLSRSQDNDTESSQEDLSYRTVGLIKKRITRVEGGCNYISRQRGTNHDQNTRSVYQCDFGNPSRFIAYFPGAQRQFRDDDNCVCCALRASVPIPLLTSQNCRYQPSWECVSSRPLSPRTATDPYTELFCRNWCSCIPPVSTLKCKQKSRRNSEEPCGSKSRSSSKAGKSLDDKMRKKVKKSGAKIDSASLDQYRVQSSEKLLMVTMKKEPKSLSAARQRQSKARAGEEISQTGMEKSTSADKQSDESKDSMYRDYMDKYRKENGNAEKDRRAANLAQDYAQVDGFSDGCGPGYCETDPICSADKRIGWGRAECHTKKCVCIAQESQTDEEYTEHRYAQEQAQVDGSEPKSGQEGVRPEGNVDLEESANDERGDGDERYVDRCGPGYCDKDPMSSPDNQVERSRGVCVSQEVQTDEESIKKETTLTQTDLQSLEKPTQTDLQGSKHETLTQTDPELSHQISTGMSPISGATIKESNYDFVRQSPNDVKEDVTSASQKETLSVGQNQIQGSYSPAAASRKSAQTKKYMKYINRGCLTEGAQEEAYTVCSSKCPRHRARQCQCLAVSPGPSQRTDAIQDYKEEQYQAYDGDNTVVHQVSSHHDLEMRTAGRTEKASPFCAPLTWEDSCEPHTVQCYCDFSRNVEKLNSSCYTEYPGRSMASSPEKSQESVPENTDQHSPYESTYQLSYGSSADPGRVHRNVITSCYDEDNCTSAERSPDYSSFPGHSQTRQYGSCATDCTGRKRSGRNFSNDSYHESQAASGSLGYEQYSDGRAINPPMQSPVQSQPNYAEAKTGLPIMICEKRSRSVTFEDESGKVRRMRNVVEHCRSKIEWEQVLTHRDCDADISHSDADFGGNNSTDDDDCTCTCRSSSSAGTEITCIESNCDLHDDFCNNEHDSRSQPNCGSLPKFNHCPCMLRTYVSLASICTPNSRSIQ